jgi:hypothetical protein
MFLRGRYFTCKTNLSCSINVETVRMNLTNIPKTPHYLEEEQSLEFKVPTFVTNQQLIWRVYYVILYIESIEFALTLVF